MHESLASHPLPTALAVALALFCVGCCASATPNFSAVIEPSSGNPNLTEAARVIEARVAARGGEAAKANVEGGTITVTGRLPEPPLSALGALLEPGELRIHIVDDQRLTELAAETSLPPGVRTEATVESHRTFCAEREEALAPLVDRAIAGRTWAVEVREGGTPAFCVILLEPAVLTNADIASAEANESDMGWHFVAVEFTKSGGERFAEVTGESVRRRLAIVIDGEVKSTPVIMERIAGGRAQVTLGGADGRDMAADAANLAAVLATKPLPVGLRVKDFSNIGPP